MAVLSDLLLNDEKLQAEAAAMVDRAHAAGDELVDRAITEARGNADAVILELGNVVRGVTDSAQAILGKTVADLNAALLGLDGWTATITIPPITIRLTKPPKKE